MRVLFGQFVKLSQFACGKGEFLGARPALDLALSTWGQQTPAPPSPSWREPRQPVPAFRFVPSLMVH